VAKVFRDWCGHMFQNEYEIQNQFNHPNIPKIIDGFSYSDPKGSVLVMELIEG
jgi:serine/threonine protein kinase